ncbi:MAG TPA: HNH endonuclease signature motif containing protein, partial [Verrucomicrobiae bacterium]
GRSDLASKAPPPWCAAPAIVGQNLRVSRTILWHSSGNISIIYAKLNNRGAFKAYPAITKFYLECIERLSNGASIQEVMQEIVALKDFNFLKAPSITLPVDKEAQTNEDFSTEAKSYSFIKVALPNVAPCSLCHARLHKNGITTDHITDKSEGGTNSFDNPQPTHPYCNTTYKKTLNQGEKPS